MQDLNNKVAYVTGGTKGIGFGIAKALLDAGLKVAISGRKLEDVERARKDLGSENVLAIASDVSDFEDEARAVALIVKEFGQLDILIANAGVGKFAPVDQLSLGDWNAMISTNLTGLYHTLKAGVEQLKLNKGYFITISSLAGTIFFARCCFS
jgi:NADP-dependent 3-hydroxy acid dehydrogenase YdfG